MATQSAVSFRASMEAIKRGLGEGTSEMTLLVTFWRLGCERGRPCLGLY